VKERKKNARSSARRDARKDQQVSQGNNLSTAGKLMQNKALGWAAVIVWMCVIFAFSAQAYSGEITEAYLGDFNISVRKCAHMFEYAMLFLLFQHACSLYPGRWLASKKWVPFGVCVLYAMTDEFHQSFVPGRSATINDVAVDSAGAAIAWFAVRFCPAIPAILNVWKKK
jgi:VanZ family protein